MSSFPKISELPGILNTKGWSWRILGGDNFDAEGFWLGVDCQGNEWLTKLRGAKRAYREIVFAKLAQSLGWSCQSSIFLQLDRQAAVQMDRSEGEAHAGHWFLDEHACNLCSLNCPLASVFKSNAFSLDGFDSSSVKYLLDWPKSELAAFIFGGHEPPGKLFTSDHELVVIDSELMFSSNPSELIDSPWIRRDDGGFSHSGLSLAMDVCIEIASLDLDVLSWITSLPSGVSFNGKDQVRSKMFAGVQYAKNYLLSMK